MPLAPAHLNTHSDSLHVPEAPVGVSDMLGRPLRDLRISVTDRCNFRCTYCMPREVFGPEHAFLKTTELLSFEEIIRVARIFVRAGVSKLRITGGEPLLRPNLPSLIQSLSLLPGVTDVALTTNGSVLERLASDLKKAGLNRLTVSLDALDETIFQKLSDTQVPVETVLRGIEQAHGLGFAPIKVNVVVKRGVNETEIVPLARHFARPGFVLRFIEYMDVGNTNGWRLDDVVPAAEILERLSEFAPLEALTANYPGETAKRYRFKRSGSEIGIIASVSAPFCSNCTRARISANGKLHTCLFSEAGTDLRSHLRDGSDDEVLKEVIRSAWAGRKDRYSEIRSSLSQTPQKTEMSVLGG
ncbi:MAG: GTP 3',8-cyclase MoaA [Verrucomicrobiota bacterium]